MARRLHKRERCLTRSSGFVYGSSILPLSLSLSLSLLVCQILRSMDRSREVLALVLTQNAAT